MSSSAREAFERLLVEPRADEGGAKPRRHPSRPALPSRHHLIDRSALGRMLAGALLINTGRGSLVDATALAERLDSSHLAGAALDVFEGEESIREEHYLLLYEEGPGLRALRPLFDSQQRSAAP